LRIVCLTVVVAFFLPAAFAFPQSWAWTWAAALSSVIQAHHPGDKVGLQWTDRSGDDHSTTVKLTAGPAS